MLPTQRIRSPRLVGLAGLFLAGLMLAGAGRGQSLTNFGSFSVTNGAFPTALAQGTDGNFYGFTTTGGSTGGGSFFKMTPEGYTVVELNLGTSPDFDGTNPTCGMIRATDGNLYGTTSTDNNAIGGKGTFFSFNGNLNTRHLFGFDSTGNPLPNDGAVPMGSLVQVANGDMYGTTSAGGTAGKGIVFRCQMIPSYVYSIVHNFGDGSVANDALSPTVGLVHDAQGNLYGTSFYGGANNQGAVYKIDTQQRLSILYSFSQSSVMAFNGAPSTGGGCHPNSKLLLASDGNLYGTTAATPGYGFGTIYRITPTGQETVLHYFGDGSVANDGRQVAAPIQNVENALVQSPTDGNIYGTTSAGGANGTGVLFSMTLAGQVSILHSFGDSSNPNDGTVPLSGVIFGQDGNLYGATGEGGSTGLTASPYSGQAVKASDVSVSATFTGGVLTITQNPANGGVTITEGNTLATLDLGSDASGGPISRGGSNNNGEPGTISLTPGNLVLSGPAYVGTLFKVQPTLSAFGTNMAFSGSVGVGVSYQVPTTQPMVQYTASGLPQGLSINAATGLISGTPSVSGVTLVTLTASDARGNSFTGILTVTILTSPLITSILNDFGSTSAPYTYQIAGSQSPTSYGATGLPAGLSVNASTGLISGTPTVTGTFPILLSATNAAGTGQATLNLVINPIAPALSQTYFPVHSFQDGSVTGEGMYPGALINGPASTLVGTTAQGGSSGFGTIFNLSASGRQNLVTAIGSAIGAPPQALLRGIDGNYYGTTQTGGQYGRGTFFEVTPDGQVSILLSYGGQTVSNQETPYGYSPVGSIREVGAGVFLGATQRGGQNDVGTIYLLRTYPGVVGDPFTILHSFDSSAYSPAAGIVQTSDTDFYGTTLAGGTAGDGAVYHYSSLDQSFAIIHSFGATATDGQMPRAELVYHDGNLYGTTTIGGTFQKGTVFAMTPAGVETVLHNFGDGSVTGDGFNPIGSIVAVDRATTGVTLFGTTQNGGANGEGAIYELDASNTLTLLHSFDDPGTPNDGLTPLGGLCLAGDGNLYGTTVAGGVGSGTFFAVVAHLNPPVISTPPPVWTLTGSLPQGLTFDSTTGTISGTPIAGAPGGLYHVTITSPTSATTSLTYALAQTFNQWAMAKVGTNLVTSAATGDGVPNMLKYLFDISPSGSMTGADRGAMPAVGVDETTVPGTPYLSLTYRQNAAMTGVGVVLESSDDMVTWTPVPTSQMISQQKGTDATTGDPIMEMGAPMDGSPQQFLRLKVTPQ